MSHGCSRRGPLGALAGLLLVLPACGDYGGDSTGVAPVGLRTFSMSAARAAHTVTTLGNGDLLIAGGIGVSGTALASCDAFDTSAVATGIPVLATGSMAVPRTRHSATLLGTGNVVALGGSPSGATEEFTPNAGSPGLGTWTTSLAAVLATPRSRHAAARLVDGRVLVWGGEDVGGSALASCAHNVSAALPFAAASPMNTARRDHTATRLVDGRVLVVGGRDNAGVPVASAEIYDPIGDTWTTLVSALSTARALHGAILLNEATADPTDDRVLLTGGLDAAGEGIRAAELFDPTSGLFSAGGDLEGPGVFDHAAVLLGNGQSAVLGGYVDGGAASPADPVRETIVYRLGAGLGVGAQDMPGRRGATRAAAIPSSGPAGSDVVLSGGYAEDGLPHAEVFLIPIDDESTAVADTLSDDEALAFGTMATAFHLFEDGLAGSGDVDLRIEEDPVFGRYVTGWVGDFHVDLEIDAGSVIGDVEGKWYSLSNNDGFVEAPDFVVDFRPSGYVDGDMDVADQDFDFHVDRTPSLFPGFITGYDTEAHLRVEVVGDHTDVTTSYLDVYFFDDYYY